MDKEIGMEFEGTELATDGTGFAAEPEQEVEALVYMQGERPCYYPLTWLQQ